MYGTAAVPVLGTSVVHVPAGCVYGVVYRGIGVYTRACTRVYSVLHRSRTVFTPFTHCFTSGLLRRAASFLRRAASFLRRAHLFYGVRHLFTCFTEKAPLQAPHWVPKTVVSILHAVLHVVTCFYVLRRFHLSAQFYVIYSESDQKGLKTQSEPHRSRIVNKLLKARSTPFGVGT